jgi:ketosteroid isomerase-like protein
MLVSSAVNLDLRPNQAQSPIATRLSGSLPAAGDHMPENLNRQRVLNLLDTYYAGDIEGALARCTEDMEYVAPAPIEILPHMGHHRGRADVRKVWQTVRDRYSKMRYEARTIVAEGDTVAVELRVFFTKRGNGRIVQFDIAAFFILRDGLICRLREIIDTFDLVQQVLERDLSALLMGERSS